MNDEQNAAQEETKAIDQHKRSAIVWYGIGTALLALYLGAAAGLSKSPVVSTLIPLLFSVIGGAGGLYLAKNDLESTQVAQRTKRIGVFIAIIAVSVAIGSVYGITVRTGLAIDRFIPRISTVESKPDLSILPDSEVYDYVSPTSSLELGLLRYRLIGLGCSEEEVHQVLTSAKRALYIRGNDSDFLQYITAVESLLRELRESFKIHPQDVDSTDKEAIRFSNTIRKKTEVLAEALWEYGSYVKKGESFNRGNMYNEVYDGIQDTYWMERTFTRLKEKQINYFEYNEALAKIHRLRTSLIDLTLVISKHYNTGWRAGERIIKQIDKLLSSGKAPVPMARIKNREPYFEVP